MDGLHHLSKHESVAEGIRRVSSSNDTLHHLLVVASNPDSGTVGPMDVPVIHANSDLTYLNSVWWFLLYKLKRNRTLKLYSKNGWSLVRPDGTAVPLQEAVHQGINSGTFSMDNRDADNVSPQHAPMHHGEVAGSA